MLAALADCMASLPFGEPYTCLNLHVVVIEVTVHVVQVVIGKLETGFGWLVDVSTCVETCSNSASSLGKYSSSLKLDRNSSTLR